MIKRKSIAYINLFYNLTLVKIGPALSHEAY